MNFPSESPIKRKTRNEASAWTFAHAEASFRQTFQVFHELWIQKPPDDVRVSGDCGIIPFNLLLGTVTAGPLYKASGSFFNYLKGDTRNMETKLYVGNLSYDTTEEDLRTLFAQAGTVESVDLIKDRNSGRSKGFGFVVMGSQSELEKAIQMFNNYELGQRQLTVNIARPREERPRGGGGGRPGRPGVDCRPRDWPRGSPRVRGVSGRTPAGLFEDALPRKRLVDGGLLGKR